MAAPSSGAIPDDLAAWLAELQTSKKITRNLGMAVADGVVVAELIQARFPKIIEMHNYSSSGSVSQKTNNWRTLNTKVLGKLNCSLRPEDISAFAERRDEAGLTDFMRTLRFKMAAYEPIYQSELNERRTQRLQQQADRRRVVNEKKENPNSVRGGRRGGGAGGSPSNMSRSGRGVADDASVSTLGGGRHDSGGHSHRTPKKSLQGGRPGFGYAPDAGSVSAHSATGRDSWVPRSEYDAQSVRSEESSASTLTLSSRKSYKPKPKREVKMARPKKSKEMDAMYDAINDRISAKISHDRRNSDAMEMRSYAFDDAMDELRAKNLEELEETEKRIARLRLAESEEMAFQMPKFEPEDDETVNRGMLLDDLIEQMRSDSAGLDDFYLDSGSEDEDEESGDDSAEDDDEPPPPPPPPPSTHVLEAMRSKQRGPPTPSARDSMADLSSTWRSEDSNGSAATGASGKKKKKKKTKKNASPGGAEEADDGGLRGPTLISPIFREGERPPRPMSRWEDEEDGAGEDREDGDEGNESDDEAAVFARDSMAGHPFDEDAGPSIPLPTAPGMTAAERIQKRLEERASREARQVAAAAATVTESLAPAPAPAPAPVQSGRYYPSVSTPAPALASPPGGIPPPRPPPLPPGMAVPPSVHRDGPRAAAAPPPRSGPTAPYAASGHQPGGVGEHVGLPGPSVPHMHGVSFPLPGPARPVDPYAVQGWGFVGGGEFISSPHTSPRGSPTGSRSSSRSSSPTGQGSHSPARVYAPPLPAELMFANMDHPSPPKQDGNMEAGGTASSGVEGGGSEGAAVSTPIKVAVEVEEGKEFDEAEEGQSRRDQGGGATKGDRHAWHDAAYSPQVTWRQEWDATHQCHYYIHGTTGVSTWEAPVDGIMICRDTSSNHEYFLVNRTGGSFWTYEEASKAIEADFERFKATAPASPAAFEATAHHANGAPAVPGPSRRLSQPD